ncbi:MAG: KH domain-containing protein [Acidimicrobiales bacterium]
MSAPTAKAVCEYIVRQIVDHPEEVEVMVSERDSAVRLDVTVADGDMGRVIGKRGRVATAIRTIVRAAGARDDAEIEVEFVD